MNHLEPVTGVSKLDNKAISESNYAWVILAVVFLASLAAPLNQFKVPPLIPVLMETFQVNLGMTGLLMAVFSITGLLLALPAGLILQKVGPKIAGLMALVCLMAGSTWGAIAETANQLLSSRVLEGVGMGLIAVVAPAAIALWFPKEKRGTAMGIWGTWGPVGGIIMFNLAPVVAISLNWQAVWWGGAIFSLVAFILYGVFMQQPGTTTSAPPVESHKPDTQKNSWTLALSNRNLWLLAFQFTCFNYVVISFATFFPTFLTEVQGTSLATASLITSLPTMVVLIAAPLAGWISDKIGSRRLLFTFPFIGIAIIMPLIFHLSGWPLYISIVMLGLITSPIPIVTFAAAPELMENPQMIGVGLAVVSIGMNLGFILGPLIHGSLFGSMGWTLAGYALIPICILGFISGWLVKVR